MKIKLFSSEFISIMYFFIVLTLIAYYVEVYLCGNYFWTFWPANYWGIPNIYSNFSFTPILGGNERGWDGQFYYYISNDLLGIGDTYNHVDSPSYRWQRIGLPIFSKFLSLLMFSNIVLPIHFILANILITSVGFYFLIQYYRELGINPFIGLLWAFSLGVLITLTNGLPDAAADALCLIAFISYLKNNKVMYMLFMSFAVLTREGYVVVAFVIFCVEFFSLIKDKYLSKKIIFFDLVKNIIVVAIPGIIFFIWQLYVTFHFGVLPASQAYNITNLPFVSIFKTLLRLITSEDNTALLGLFIFITITALSIILSYIKMFKNKKYIPIFFYGILIISLGDTVMLYYRDFLKAITIFIALLPILVIGFNKKIIIFVYGILIISVLFSLEEYPFVRGDGFEPLGFTVDIANSYNATALTNFNSKLEILDSSSTRYIKKLLNIDKEILTVKIKNNSNQIWFANANKDGNYATMLTYHFFKVGNLSHPIGGDYRSKLSKNILPNDESIEKMIIYYPKEKGKYILRITLLQHPVAFFYNVGGAFKDIAIEVK